MVMVVMVMAGSGGRSQLVKSLLAGTLGLEGERGLEGFKMLGYPILQE